MKTGKKYVFMAALLAIILFWKLNTLSSTYAQVETFRGAALSEEVFYPLMAENINKTNPVSVYVNGRAYANNYSDVILSRQMKPMVSLGFIRDYLGCAAYKSDESGFTIQSGGDLYEITIDKRDAFHNGEEISLDQVPVEISSKMYIGLEDLCNELGYDYGYAHRDGIVNIRFSQYADLPDSYDLRWFNRVGGIRDQGNDSTCWAYAAMEAFESALRPMEAAQLSVDDMLEHVSVGSKVAGDYTQAIAYLLSWQGPVIKSGESAAYHLQNVRFYKAGETEEIKRAVLRYGGVSSSIYASVSASNLNNTRYYNAKTYSFYCNGDESPNHEVVIIGWDDDYPASNFSIRPPGNGAFVCQNSWGTRFGEDGIFYVSYYDKNIGTQGVSYSGIENYFNYDNIYQSDMQGWVGRMGYSKSSAYGANVFTAKDDETIEAVGFYATEKNTSYQIFFVPKYKNKASLSNREPVASGKLDEAGFYTIRFNNTKDVNKGEEFAVILMIDTPDSERPLAIEYQAGVTAELVDISDGKGYVSSNGLEWTSIEEEASANLCIKAYSKKRKTEKTNGE